MKQLYNFILTARTHLCWLETWKIPCCLSFLKFPSLLAKMTLAKNHDLCENRVLVTMSHCLSAGDWSTFPWLLAALSLLLCFGKFAVYCINQTNCVVGEHSTFYLVLKKLQLVVCLILQAGEAFHYLTSNTPQEMESLENRSH